MLSIVRPGDMVTTPARHAYDRIVELVANGRPVTIPAILGQDIAPQWIGDVLRGNVGWDAAGAVDYWADFVVQKANARRTWEALSKGMAQLGEGKHPDDVAWDISQKLRNPEAPRKARTRSLHDVITEEGYPAIVEWMDDPKKLAGPSTGIQKLDTYLGGLGAGRLIALGADTGIGKSLFVQHLARQCGVDGVPVHVVSTEMSDMEVLFRFAFMEAGWDKLP